VRNHEGLNQNALFIQTDSRHPARLNSSSHW